MSVRPNQILPVWSVQARVSAHECDFRLRWKPAALFLSMLQAASGHVEHLSFGYESMHANHMAWVLSRFRINFQRFPLMDEAVVIHTWPRGVQQRLFFTRDFELQSADGSPLASATSAWLLLNPEARRLLPPSALKGDLPDNTGRSAIDLLLEKINPPDDLTERMQLTPGYSDVDVMGHANSARYVEWLCDALGMDAFAAGNFAWLQLNFSHETRPGEQLSLRMGRSRTGPAEWLVEGYNLSARTRGFEGAFGWKED